jgi:hypothetical protein
LPIRNPAAVDGKEEPMIIAALSVVRGTAVEARASSTVAARAKVLAEVGTGLKEPAEIDYALAFVALGRARKCLSEPSINIGIGLPCRLHRVDEIVHESGAREGVIERLLIGHVPRGAGDEDPRGYASIPRRIDSRVARRLG